MKYKLLQFPQIFRKIFARLKVNRPKCLPTEALAKAGWKWAESSKIFFLLGAVYLLFLILPLPLTSFEKTKMQTFYNTNSAQNHFLLAQFFYRANNLELAETEAKLAVKLEPQSPKYRQALEEILTLKEKPKKLQNELAFWQKISQEKKGFRDAFFQQAIILYQLKRFSQAKEILQKVFELDPNFEPASLLLSFLH